MAKHLLLPLLAGLALGSESDPARIQKAEELSWTASGSLPPGAEYHPIVEDKKTGAIQSLARFPSGYELGFHSHSHREIIVVLKGRLLFELKGRSEILQPGSYVVIPAGTEHALKGKGWGETWLLLSLDGAFDVKPAGSPTR
ncbi:MAG: cupin domain-containing protein [Elusimicrobia bacterium]|nr:cupin domain-containing protein [Elusimicrobiota bacterium]